MGTSYGRTHIRFNRIATEGLAFHEYGHHVEYDNVGQQFYDLPDDMGHSIDTIFSNHVGWTEGWAEFFAAACHQYWYMSELPDLPHIGLPRLQFLEFFQNDLPSTSVPGRRKWNEGSVAAFLFNLWDDAELRIPRGPVDPDYEGDNDDIHLDASLILDKVSDRFVPNTTTLREDTHIDSYLEALLEDSRVTDLQAESITDLFNSIFYDDMGPPRPATASGLSISGGYSSRSLSWSDNTVPSGTIRWIHNGITYFSFNVFANNEEGYRIYRSSSPGSSWNGTFDGYKPVGRVDADVTSWDDPATLATGTYGYIVTAYNRSGSSIPKAQGTIDVTSPANLVYFGYANHDIVESGHLLGESAPQSRNLKKSVMVNLTEAPLEPVVIPITLSPDTGDFTVKGLSSVPGVNSGTLRFARGRTQKSFTIKAVYDTDFDTDTIDISFGTLPEGYVAGSASMVTIHDVPPKPTGLKAEYRSREVRLTWDDLSPPHRALVRWEVQYWGGTGPDRGEWHDAGLTPSYTVSDLMNGQTYRLRVRGVTAYGYSEYSDIVTERPIAEVAVPYNGAIQLKRDPRDDIDRGISATWSYRLRKPGQTFSPTKEILGTAVTLKDLANDQDDPHRLRISVDFSDGTSENFTLDRTPLSTLPDPPNLAPLMPTGMVQVSMPENQTDTGEDYMAVDPDGDTLELSVQRPTDNPMSPDGELLVMDGGRLKFKQPPDAEMGQEMYADGTYNVAIVASDGKALSPPLNVEVTVTDEPEPGMVSLVGVAQVKGSLEGTVTDSDIPGDIDPWQWEWQREVDGEFQAILSSNVNPYMPVDEDVCHRLRAKAWYFGDSAVSEPTDKVLGKPNPPVVKAEGGDEVIELSWEEPSTECREIDSYDYRYYEVGGTEPEWTPASGTMALTLEELTNGQEYMVEVRAVNSIGNSIGSATATPAAGNLPPEISGDETPSRPENGASPWAVSIYTGTDPDDDPEDLDWTLSGPNHPHFHLLGVTYPKRPQVTDPTRRQLAFIAAPDHEAQDTYGVTIKLEDPDGLEDSLDVTVSVTDVNECPSVSGLPHPSLDENGSSPWTVATYTAQDQDDAAGTLTWSISGDERSYFLLYTASDSQRELRFRSNPNHEERETYDIRIEAEDPDGLVCGQDVTVTVNDVNEPPVITGPASPSRDENGSSPWTVATYTGEDPEDAARTLTWNLAEGEEHFHLQEMYANQQELRFDSNPNHEAGETYSATITLEDPHGLQDEIGVTVTVNDVPEAPDKPLGLSAVTMEEGETDTGAEYTSTDPEGTTIQWSLTGDDFEALEISEAGRLTFVEAPDYEAPGDADEDRDYEVNVVASDGALSSLPLAVTVTVEDGPDPGVVTFSPDPPKVGQTVTAIVEDPDEGVTNQRNWNWSRVDAPRGARAPLSTTAEYRPTSQDVDYRLRVSVTYDDAQGTDQPATGTSEPVPRPPCSLSLSASTASPVSFAENGPGAVATYTVTRLSGCNRALPLSWSLSGADASDFEEWTGTGSSQALEFVDPPDHETKSSYGVTVAVTDGSASAPPLEVTVTVTDVPEAPSKPSGLSAVEMEEGETDTGAEYTSTDPEGTTIQWSLTGDDFEALQISEEGRLTFVEAPDYEAPGDADEDRDYQVNVVASDGSLSSLPLAVTVTVDNVDEPGVVTFSPNPPSVGEPVTASVEDPDGGVTKLRNWSWTVVDAPRGARGSSSPPEQYTPTFQQVDYRLRVTVTYNDAQGPNKNATGTSEPVPRPPCSLSLSASAASPVSYAENGTGAVATYTVTRLSGCNRALPLSWSLSGADASDFEEWTGTGSSQALEFVAPPDHETKSSYGVTVAVTDGSASAPPLEVTVNVTDVNEPPVISGPASPSRDENGSSPWTVATYTGEDPEDAARTLTWDLAEGEEHFHLQEMYANQQELRFDSNPNHEEGETYEARITLEDPHGLQGEIEVTVTVNDVNEPPVISGPASPSVPENSTAVATYTATDPEDDSVRWEVATGTGTFSIGRDTGVLAFKSAKDYEALSSYTFPGSIRATDNGSPAASSTLAVTATVTDAPERGTVTMSPSRPYVGDQVTATLTDPDRGVTGPTWSWRTEDSGSRSTSTQSYRYTVPSSAEGKILVASVSYSDVHGSQSADTTSTGTVRRRPCSLSLSASKASPVSYAENGTGAVATYTASASNCGGLTWSPVGVEDTDFQLRGSGSSRSLHFRNAPNYEAKSSYEVTVTVRSGSESASRTVTVNVTDVNEPPVITGPASPSRDENGSSPWTVATYTGEDPDDAARTLTWDLAEGEEHFHLQEMYANQQELRFDSNPNHEEGETYEARITLEDPHGLQGEIEVTVTVNDVNEPPVISGPASPSVPEHTTPVATYTATDPENHSVRWEVATGTGTFSIGRDTGALAFKSAKDYEALSSYTFTGSIRATDNGSPAASSTLAVTATVTNVDEPGTVTLSDSSPHVGDQLTATLTDPDGGITGPTWSWTSERPVARSSSAQSLRYTVPVGDFGRILTASVGYTDNHGPGKRASRTASAAVRAHRPDPPPDFDAVRGDGQVALSWGPADGNGAPITGYGYRYRSDTGSWPASFTSISVRSKTIGSLDNGTPYHFQVEARNIGGASSPSEDSATPAGTPGAPQNLATDRQGGNGFMELTWEAASANGSGILHYYYRYKKTGDDDWRGWYRRTGGADARSKSWTNFDDGAAYVFQVRARNGVGYGSTAQISASALGPGGSRGARGEHEETEDELMPEGEVPEPGEDDVVVFAKPVAEGAGGPVAGGGRLAGGAPRAESVQPGNHPALPAAGSRPGDPDRLQHGRPGRGRAGAR